MAARFPFFIVPLTLLLSSAAASLDNMETTVHFSYSGETGPEKWGSLSPFYSACSNGKSQSPVNIVKDEAVTNKNLQPLIRDYYPANATLVNNGFNIGLHYAGYVGVLSVDGKNYTLKQMHWHSPSEHLIDGVQYSAELHLVHMADDGSISVVGILYHYGDADPLLTKIKKSLDELAKEVCAGNEEAQIPTGVLDVKHMKRSTRKYYRYIGSLTTPPCTENVIWNVLGKVRSISKEQVAALKAPLDASFKKNARPAQSLNGRHIEQYDELGGDN